MSQRAHLCILFAVIIGVCAAVIAPLPALYGAISGAVIAGSLVSWRLGRITAPARDVARAWVRLGNVPLGEATRALSEAVYKWDKAA